MSSILYVWAMSAKNRVLEIKRKPALLILYLILIAFIAGMVWLGRISEANPESADNFPLLKLLFFALSVSFLMFGVYRGLAAGGSFFEMSDVNLMFVSPISPRAILIHGITRQTKIAIFAGFFILFQSSNLKINFGLELSSVLIIFAGFALTIMMSEILAIFIYSKTSGSPKRQAAVKAITALSFVPAALKLALSVGGGQPALRAVYDLSGTAYVDFIPITGWITRGCMDVVSGNVLTGLTFISFTVAFGAALVIIITLGKIDYYEDVLCATESNYERRKAKSEGNLGDMLSSKKVRVSKTGLSGLGAGVFFSKHFMESKRGNILGLINGMSAIFMCVALFMAFVLRESASPAMILPMLMWAQIFMVGTGKGLKELLSHYIYMIPEDPFIKLFWSSTEHLLRTFLEACIIFAATGFILKASLPIIACCVLAYTMFTLLLLGVNYLSMRLFRETLNRGLLMLLYSFSVIIIMSPGIVGAVAASLLINQVVGLLALSLWETAVALLLLSLSKGVLHKCDIITVKIT